MPLREYACRDESASCPHCRRGFEVIERIRQEPMAACPKCGAPVRRLVSAPRFARIASNLDDRAKSAGFHKLKRLGKGEYEKQY